MASNEWYDDVDTNAFLWAGVISVLVFIALVIGVQAAYYSFQRYENDLKETQKEPTKSIAVLAEQNRELAEYKKYTVAEKTRIAIPIDKAMDMIARETIGAK